MRVDPFAELPLALRRGVIAIGNFEGIHRGHCRLLAKLRSRARQVGGPAIAVSFDPHPLQLLRPQFAPTPLVWTKRKVEILRASGADGVAILRTSPEFLRLSAEEFFEQIVLGRFEARGMVEGRNFGYGHNRGGDIDVLSRQCQGAGLSIDIVDIITGQGDAEVSSSRIRREIAAGRIDVVTALLGRPHRIQGNVIAGDRRGRAIGFPTANLAEISVLIPSEGVYAGVAEVDGKRYPAACNIGPNPTFGVEERKFEAHLVGFEGDLYGRAIEIDLIARLRDVRSFAGIEELKSQLGRDVAQTASAAAQYHHPFGCDLGQTVFEWLRTEVAPALEPVGIQIRRVRLENGELTLLATAQGPLLPALRTELMLKFAENLRRTFAEIRTVRWADEQLA